jgi:WD40 repeat protein
MLAMHHSVDRYVTVRSFAQLVCTPYEKALAQSLELPVCERQSSVASMDASNTAPREQLRVRVLDAPKIEAKGCVVIPAPETDPDVALFAIDQRLYRYNSASRSHHEFRVAPLRWVDAFPGTHHLLVDDASIGARAYDQWTEQVVSSLPCGRITHVRALDDHNGCVLKYGYAQLWDRRGANARAVTSPSPLRETPALDPSGQQLAAVGRNNSVLLWDVRQLQRPLHVVPPSAERGVRTVLAWHASRHCALTVASGRDVVIRSNEGSVLPLLHASAPPVVLHWSQSSSSTLVAGLKDGTIATWSDRCARQTDVMHADGVFSELAVSSRCIVGVDAESEEVHFGERNPHSSSPPRVLWRECCIR